MQDPDLDRLLRKWAAAELDTDATRDCPTLSVLWYHESEGRDLGQYTGHVIDCPRCQERLALIRTERARTRGLRFVGVGSRASRRREPRTFIPAILKVGAVAASIALVFTIWPVKEAVSFKTPIDAFGSRAYLADVSDATRGETTTPAGTAAPMPAWIATALADEDVQEAINRQEDVLPDILHELLAGRLAFDADHRLIIARTIGSPRFKEPGPPTERADRQARLLEMVTTDRDATERIVNALVRTLPGTSPDDRPALRRSLDRWRMANVFGRPPGSDGAPPTGD